MKVFIIVLCIILAVFLLSLITYFFNLDMKISAKFAPILNRHYDKIKRDRNL